MSFKTSYKFGKIFLLLFFLIFQVAFAQESFLSQEIKETRTQRYVLDNGMTVIIKAMPESPLVSLVLAVNAGSATEGEFLGSGVSHFVEHMLFKGTDKRKVGQIAGEIESLGGKINGFTTHDYTAYTITLPSEKFNQGIEILADAIINSQFDSQEIEKEREVILSEIRLINDEPDQRAYNLLFSGVYTKHPYQHPVIGHDSLLRALTREDLYRYYRKMYNPNNMVLSVGGGLNPEDALSRIKEEFKGFVQKPYVLRDLSSEPEQLTMRRIDEEYPTKLTRLFLGFKGVSISNRDIFALDVLAVVLGQGKSSRLYREVYKNKQLVYSVGAFNFTPLDKGIFAIKALIEKQKSEKAIKAILAEIDKIKSRGIDNQELKKAKKQVLSDYLFSRQTTAGVARDIALNEILVGDADFSQRYVEAVKNLTKENIQGVAKKYLNKQTLTIIALSPLSSKEEAKKEIELKKTEIKKIVLDNGLAVLLKEDATFPLVSIKVFFRGGLRAETKENNGISNLTSRLLLAGTKDRSAEDIDISIESLGASLDSFSGNNSFGISLEMLSADIDQGIAILADLLSNPVFSDAELKHEKEKALAQIKADEDSVFKVAFKLLKKTLLGEHPYRFDPLGEEESLKKLTRKEIIEFYKKFCVPNNMVLTVFGDIESEKVLQLIKDKFAKLSAGKLPQISLPESFPEKFKEITISAPKEQAVIMLGFAGVSITAPDRYPLEVLNALMTSMSGRLYQEIREKSGQAYTLGGSSVLGIERGFYYFYVSTTFENVERVKEIILREIKNLQTDFVSDDELSKVKVYLCGWQKFNLETNSALSLEAGFDELYGLGFNNYKLYQEKISQVSKEEIMRVAKTYLNLDKAVTVILRSKENTSPQ